MLSNHQVRTRGRSNIELKSPAPLLPFYSRAIVGSCNGAVLQWPIKALTRLVGAFKAADPSQILLGPAIANAYDAVLARSCSPTAASLPLLSLFDLRAYDLDVASTTELRKHRTAKYTTWARLSISFIWIKPREDLSSSFSKIILLVL